MIRLNVTKHTNVFMELDILKNQKFKNSISLKQRKLLTLNSKLIRY
ncbi:MAG: hypothetical protein RLZZ175_196 [Bacteroidota bacterium]|jgi:hypothetical protein